MSSLIRATGVNKRYGALQALNDVSFELNAGEVMALLGENGAGKSTLIKVLAGLTSLDSGTIEIDGVCVDVSSPSKARRAGIAMVTQEMSLIPTLTAAENVFQGSDVSGSWKPSRLDRLAAPHLDLVGLPEASRRVPVEELSVAERQLIEIARVLARDAKILIFDEPTAALADTEIERVMSVVRELATQGKGVVYVTHRLGEVLELAQRATVMRDGQSLDPVSTERMDVDDIVEAMLGRKLEAVFPPRPGEFGDMRLAVDRLAVDGMLDPFSLSVRAGEIVGLAGQLGSGAPQILRALAGIESWSSGDVFLDGHLASYRGVAGAISTGIAYCSDDRKRDGTFERESVALNFVAPAFDAVTPKGWLSRKRVAVRSTASAQMFSFPTNRIEQSVGTFSGGNQQKVALGKWVSINPRVLLVEEPTRGVDVGARAEIYQNLRKAALGGLAIIFTSSDLPEVLGLADTVVTFYRGRTVRTAAASELTEEQTLIDLTHGPERRLE